MLIMAVVRASCPEHKDVDIDKRDLTVNLDLSGRAKDFYRYTCPVDKSPVIKHPADNVIEFLIKNGCEVVIYDTEISQSVHDEHEAIARNLGSLTTQELAGFEQAEVHQFNQAAATELQL